MATAHRKTGEKERIAERRRQVFALRKTGASLRQIAEHLNCSNVTVLKDLRVTLAELAQETANEVEQFRALELARLDQMQSSIWQEAVGVRGREGWISEPKPYLIDRVLKIQERRAKLYGLDMPMKVEHSLSAEDVKLYLELKAATEVLKLPTSDAVSQFIQVLREQAQKVNAE